MEMSTAAIPRDEEEGKADAMTPPPLQASSLPHAPAVHHLPIEDVLQLLRTDVKGLTQHEVAARLQKDGLNILPEKQGVTLLDRLFEQLHSPLIYVLLAGAALSFGFNHLADGVVILAVIIVNVAMGLWMESKAERTTKALKSMLSQSAKVRRDDERMIVEAKFLTVGDIFYLQAGDIAPADGRVINSSDLSVLESALTGESHPILKTREHCEDEQTPLSERTCMVYSGTQVLKGSAMCVVTSIGVRCEIGKINSMLETVENQKTPLVLELERLGMKLAGAILLVSTIALITSLLRGYSVKESFSFAIGVTVAAIPEGLPSCVTITFAVGVRAMAAHRAIVKSLPAAETLGSVSVICSDKTGTLTKNEMVVRMLCTRDQCYEVKENPSLRLESPDSGLVLPPTQLFQHLSPGLYCNDSSLSTEEQGSTLEPGNGRFKIIGDPTESALLALGVSFFGPEKIQSISRNTPVESIPFDSTNKFMATLHELQLSQFAEIFSSSERESESAYGKCRVVFVKGAPEKIIDFCATSEEARAVWKAQAMRMGEQGMRVLGCAYKVVSPSVHLTIELISDLNMSCLVGIADPPREEAIHAIQSAHNAGITVKMITGDHPVTARTIGRQLGLLPGTHTAVTGADLDALIANNDLATFDQIVRNNNIFARTSPEHKLLIVQSLQRQNISCSMTGDGVNDAPALKQANIGVAMGITGTEVAKDASHIIITDDNFATIVEAIRYGRCTYDNLVKILVFVLPTNAAQAFSIIMALIIGVEVPLTALQILWVNMITSVTLGLILAFERPNEQIMQSAPRRSGKSIFGKFLSWRVVFVSTLLVVAVLGNFHWEKQRIGSLDKLRTISVNTLSVGQLFYLFNCRNLKHNESPLKLLVGNRALLFGLMGVALAQGLFTYSTFFHYLFRTESLDLLSWGKMVLLGVVIFIILEAEKAATKLWNHLRGSGGHQLVVMGNDSSTAVATAADDAMQQI